jgi:hypothetical protein
VCHAASAPPCFVESESLGATALSATTPSAKESTARLLVAVGEPVSSAGRTHSQVRSNISVNADVRERAFVQRRANQQRRFSSERLASRGRRLP